MTTIIPDKIIELPLGDNVKIFVRNFEIEFWIKHDNDGIIFKLKKDEVRRWVK